MRFFNEIIAHCFDTRTDQSFGVEDVNRWHIEKGYDEIGYHYVIRLTGDLEKGRSLNKKGAHCRAKGKNNKTVGVAFEGGKNPDGSMWNKPTDEQIDTFRELKCSLEYLFQIPLKVSGHRDYDSGKTCPNFDVKIL